MNANLVKTDRLRRSPQGQGTLYPLPPSAKSVQQKPVFRVLEDSASSDALVPKTEHEAVAKVSQRLITSRTSFDSISYAFSFPLCDLLICEFPEFVTNSEQSGKNGHTEQSVTSVTSNLPVKISRAMYYIYQKVVRRKAIPFQPSPKNPSYLLCYVEEELECGHKVTVHQSEIETLTARKRSCHECSSWFGGLRLPEGKKPNKSILRSYERIKKQAGESQWWALIFGGACLGLLALIVFTHLPKLYVYQYPADTFQIVQKIDPFHYRMRRMHTGLDSFSREFTTTFCSNYPLAFSAGETLIWLAYEDKGCWDVSGKELGYLFLRDDKGNVILAPNCYWKDDVLATCDGTPKFQGETK